MNNRPSAVSRKRLWWLPWLGVCLISAALPMAILSSGLDQAEPVGPYLNGVFPSSTPSGVVSWEVERAFPDLTFDDMIFMLPMPGTDQLIVGQRNGMVYQFDQGAPNPQKAVFADLADQTAMVWDGGMFGMAFHPEYGQPNSPNRGYVYLLYCARQSRNAYYPPAWANGFFNCYMRLSRFTVPDGASAIDTTSEVRMLNLRLYNGSHRGGGLTFGSDSMLYLTLGDQFKYGPSQDLVNSLEGGTLRIDVNQDPARSHPPIRTIQGASGNTDEISGVGYFIPNDNPFLNPNGDLFEEYCAIGNRAPHRLTHDPVTGQLWIGEIGDYKRDELNIVKIGANYGWPFREGTYSGPWEEPAELVGTLTEPVLDFGRSDAQSIIGGYVYRGSKFPSLVGKYVCGDYVTGKLWSVDYDAGTGTSTKELMGSFSPGNLVSFGTDAAGELYLMGQGEGSEIYTLKASSTTESAPQWLSATGAFSDLTTMTPALGIIPYEMNVPFWSDQAVKTRWIVLPNDGVHDDPSEQIAFSENQEWSFPEGTVFIKHFEMELDEQNPAIRKKLETRFMVHGSDGLYYGLTYKWNDAQTDAELLGGGAFDTLSIATATGTRQQIWEYPDRSTCLVCHNVAAKQVLGPHTRQLNGHAFYPSSGRSGHQLETYEFLDWFESSISLQDTATYLTSAKSDDTSQSLEFRARSYLDANCSSCHRPGTANRSEFDARLNVPLFAQKLFGEPVSNDLGIEGAKLIVPQDTAKSLLYQRLKSTREGVGMPPIAKRKVDTAGVNLIVEWIMNMTSAPEELGTGLRGTYFADASQTDTLFQRIDSRVDFIWGQGSPFLGTPTDDFAVKWEGQLLPVFSETYDFTVTADGGIRLWVDGQLLIDAWNLTGNQTYLGSTALISGQKVDIVLEYRDQTGSAKTSLYWESESQPYELIPADFLYPPAGKLKQLIAALPVGFKLMTDPDFFLLAQASSGLPVEFQWISGPASLTASRVTLDGTPGIVEIHVLQPGDSLHRAAEPLEIRFEVADPAEVGQGIRGSYFAGIGFDSVVFSRLDTAILFEWGSAAPSLEMPEDEFSVRWEGFLDPDESGTYEFKAETDDGVRLKIRDQWIIDDWTSSGLTTRTATIDLNGGDKVPFVMEYYEASGDATARLSWSGPNLDETIVRSRDLFDPATFTLEADWLDFTLTDESPNVRLNWTVAAEENTHSYVIERSEDGVEFEALSALPAAGYVSSQQSYQGYDGIPLLGESFYRIAQIDLFGSASFSEVLSLDLAEVPLTAFPNPIHRGGRMWVNLATREPEAVSWQLYTHDGRLVMRAPASPLDVTTYLPVDIPSDLKVGVYMLAVEFQSETSFLKILVQ
ncbi:PA14 domain-containing protein [Pontibacter sp. G13]|uniref:PA14 domain-containing protein n=1 Tax=Pontibacter sp. G13 TaxID=3074898 RepID=UPI00288A0293|nr:PA14 domain-containing protein [Pontibacter sp. G13]WNJ17714.1 PA14 domain-containing protein [Pontibacter sp. G13]